MNAFERSDAVYAGLVGFLRGEAAAVMAHEELEVRLRSEGREIERQLLQDNLDLRAMREVRLDKVSDAGGVDHNAVEANHRRLLTTIFGAVDVSRLAYRARGRANLHPADAVLNLPDERHSHGLRELAAVESTRGSYEEAVEAIGRATGVELGKRQVEDLARRVAVDFEDFYASTARPKAEQTDLLVISADGKGIVMRPDSLRTGTAKAARQANPKLKTRLSKGEKRNRKRMAELAAVYDATPIARRPADILPGEDLIGPPPAAPVAKAKWLTASVADDTATVIHAAFDEAERRDPDHARTWVALVDGNAYQIDRINAEAKQRQLTVHVVIDFIHVLEYLWSAAWCFFPEGDAAAEAWVRDKGLEVLSGKAGLVAGSIRRKATYLNLDKPKRAKADEAARYLLNTRRYLDYPTALAQGWPIATGVIEGACRHIVRDRFDITGARWSVEGAEAILRLRALRANGHWADYWRYHLKREHQRVHESRYAKTCVPRAA